MVGRPEDLENVNPSTTVVRIAHTVGENKRIRIIEQAKKKNLRVLNPGIKREAEEAKAEEVQVETDAGAGTEESAEETSENTPSEEE